ncbi:ATP-dependent DNA ligase [Streptomyces sp. NPDC005355]|uniref:ATP-dependent DNA ligase n=1 Tax=Streptomyces sp. NPDC005355 TaxID=3157038 RepID=UPI0033BAF47E
MTWSLPEPMLTVAVDSPAVPAGWAAEPKWDGYRAQLAVHADGRVLLRSRQGTDMTASFPEIRAAPLAQLPADTGLDGELVVWEADRLAFERLQQRLARRGAGAADAARQWPAHYVAFDLLRLSRTDTTSWPYRRRRATLESVFAARRLSAPWALCPSTTEADVVREWLTWASVGMEGVVFKRLDDVYRPSVRGWQKYKVRETSEAIVGAITGSLAVPRTLQLGRYDDGGRLQYVGRTTALARAAGAAVAGLLARGRRGHPWTAWSFSAGWGSQEKLDVTLVETELVVEVGVDVARDASGRWRHPARWHRARPDLSPADVPRLTSPPH